MDRVPFQGDIYGRCGAVQGVHGVECARCTDVQCRACIQAEAFADFLTTAAPMFSRAFVGGLRSFAALSRRQ